MMDENEDDFDFLDQAAEMDFLDSELGVDDGTNGNADAARYPTGSGPQDLEVTAITDVTALFPRARKDLVPVIVGCVAQAQLGCGIDLRKLSCGARNVEFVPLRSATATMRIREPSCVCMIRNSGSISVVGAVCAGAARQAAELCTRVIRKVLDLKDVNSFRFRVRSVMAKVDLGHPIRLDTLQREFSDCCAYEPETFCACIVKLRGTGSNAWAVTCNVYVTGKVTLIGARSNKELLAAYYVLLPMLAKHSKT